MSDTGGTSTDIVRVMVVEVPRYAKRVRRPEGKGCVYATHVSFSLKA